MPGVRYAEMGEGLRRTGRTALRLLPAALRREHFVSHVYMVPDATDKTRDVASCRTGQLTRMRVRHPLTAGAEVSESASMR